MDQDESGVRNVHTTLPLKWLGLRGEAGVIAVIKCHKT